MVAVKNTISSSLVPSLKDHEVVTVNIGYLHAITLWRAYVAPSALESYRKSLINYLTSLRNLHYQLVLVMTIQMKQGCLSGSSPASKQFCEFGYNSNLSQLVQTPTHVKGNILDLVMMNEEDLIVFNWSSQVSGSSYPYWPLLGLLQVVSSWGKCKTYGCSNSIWLHKGWLGRSLQLSTGW